MFGATLTIVVAIFGIAFCLLTENPSYDSANRGHEMAYAWKDDFDKVGYWEYLLLSQKTPPPISPRSPKKRIVLVVMILSILLLISASGLYNWIVTISTIERTMERIYRSTENAAHELKTPIAVMQSMVEHAIRHADGNTAVEQLGADVMEELGRLRNVVQRLLLLAQSDAGRLLLRRDDVDLSALAKLLAEDLSLLAGEDAIKTTITEGLHVVGERSFLMQAFQNILSNATQYNREGFTIAFSLAKAGDKAVVTVSNGIDPLIPPNIDKIFERFYRGATLRSSRPEGTGIGLNIAKEIIETSGGTLSATLDDDRIVFRATLPLRQDDSARPSAPTETVSNA